LKHHYRQAQTLIRRTRRIERVWEQLIDLCKAHALPERTALAMLEASNGLKVRNASYRVAADISNNLASRGLKALVDAGLLVAEGDKRGREYGASQVLNEIWARHRLDEGSDDPFAAG
jgi:predicted HTH transcriptional regulator